MCRQFSCSSAVIIGIFGVLVSVNASAQSVNTLSDVSFTKTVDRIDVRITPKSPLTVDNLTAHTKGSLLVLNFDGATARRRWVKANDRDIKRVLVHPVKSGAPASSVRIRFHKKIGPSVLKNIRVRAEGNRLIAAIPRTEKIALHWQSTSAQSPTQEKPSTAKADTAQVSAPLARAIENDGLVGPVLPGSDIKLDASGTSDKSAQVEATTNGLAQPDLDPAGKGVVIVATLFLALIGLVFWKKMRHPRVGSGEGPMIKPVGTHMLGPKQGLLLVDVAGQMVLLGTSDKGVQMLTTIENDNAAAAQDIASRVHLDGQEVPQAALDRAGKEGFATRFGRALERIRGASSGQTPSVKYGMVQDSDNAQSTDDYDPLAALAGNVDDKTPGDGLNRTSRRQFNPVRPRVPQPVHHAQPEVDDQDALLAKLRSLQSA